MNQLAAIATIVVPILALMVPGLALVKRPNKLTELPATAALTILWSISLLTVTALILATVGLPPFLNLLIGLLFTAIFATKNFSIWGTRYTLAVLTPALILLALFSLPYLNFHQGLPTGDSQKAIVWAEDILSKQSFPDYSQAPRLLNRDPVDFYTPGLHALTAAIMQSVPAAGTTLPYTTVGFTAILAGLALTIITMAIASQVAPSKHQSLAVLLSPLLLLTQFRFLRYLREPGYHFQNIVGELLLFGLLFIVLRLLYKWNKQEVLLALLLAITLALSHQFSAFLAPFLLTPVILVGLRHHRAYIKNALQTNRLLVTIAILTLIVLLLAGGFIGLHKKIPHIFTTSPHLINLVPSFTDYSHLMGATWLTLGLIGLVVLLNSTTNWPARAFAASTLVMLALSQGPRLGIDIPPVRALFYTSVLLSISGSVAIAFLVERLSKIHAASYRRLSYAVLIAIILIPAYTSVTRAYQLSHTVRTNSTLLPEYLPLIEHLKSTSHPDGAILIDDYNRRSSSWLALAGKPMVTRIGADISRQMQEAGQSDQRYRLYLKQLDFEKIFSIGSHPEITRLLDQHRIRFITGIDRSSATSLAHNPSLQKVAQGGDVHLFQRQPEFDLAGHECAHPETLHKCLPWLLRPSTLANDIGDAEDVFKHLPASLRATRLSEPQAVGNATYRTTTAPLIPITFNIGDYAAILWDQEGTNQPDTSVELVVTTLTGKESFLVTTPTGAITTVQTNGHPAKIAPHDVPFDDNGFITLVLQNPEQTAIDLDLIALGLARTP